MSDRQADLVAIVAVAAALLAVPWTPLIVSLWRDWRNPPER